MNRLWRRWLRAARASEASEHRVMARIYPVYIVFTIALGIGAVLASALPRSRLTALELAGPLIAATVFVLFSMRLGKSATRPEDMHSKIGRLSGLLAEGVAANRALLDRAAALSEELSAELAARSAALEVLRAETEHWDRLSRLREDEAEAVARLVEAKVQRGVRHLDLMGIVFAASGWVAALLVAVITPYL